MSNRQTNKPKKIESISQLHRFLGLAKPQHPLISVFDFTDIKVVSEDMLNALSSELYVVAIKKDCSTMLRYGQNHYDFQEGIMYYFAPHQVLQFEEIKLSSVEGMIMVIHPDFLYGSSLSHDIKNYGYFSYASNEALYLSDKEEAMLNDISANIKRELDANMDNFTQDLILSNVELLLKYCDRFYNRQFMTRKKVNHDLLTRLEELLDYHFRHEKLTHDGIPSVQYLADELNLSPNYLSDMLRVHTGQTTQQHIQNKIVEKAKELLSTTQLSVSEIAYFLGFEHPQSFHRLFKKKEQLSPLEFRQSFN